MEHNNYDDYMEMTLKENKELKRQVSHLEASYHSIRQEIWETLKARGYWVPKDLLSCDLITAVGRALEDKKLEIARDWAEEAMLWLELMRDLEEEAGRPTTGIEGLIRGYHEDVANDS